MRHWFTRRGAEVETEPFKRFDPGHWTIDFPRGTIASMVRGEDAHSLVISSEFLREGDLVGLIWSSEDLVSHPAHARVTSKDYAGVKLSFRWQSSGLMPLDLSNGATLTIEGRDAQGASRAWFVRLWNYSQGSANDAVISLDFDALDAGFTRPDEAERVWPSDIDRMFISLVPPDYVEGSDAVRSSTASASVTISDVVCRGPGSVIDVGSSWQPTTGLSVCTAYDDHYHLEPSRLVETAERLGYAGTINHYVGMSHYMALGGDGLVDPSVTMNAPALAWHRAFANEVAARGYELIWSISYEILDQFCPEDWKQREASGNPALTNWVPPSTLVSPACEAAIDYLGRLAAQLVAISQEVGLRPRVQIGEPWWWVNGSGQPCLYDAAAISDLGGNPPVIESLYSPDLTIEETDLLDAAGALLASSTATIGAAARAADPTTELLLLAFLPTVLDEAAPETRRANLPVDWAAPAFDRLQVEDYDWVTGHVSDQRRLAAMDAIDERLGYPRDEQHYFAGFAIDAARAGDQWPLIVDAARKAKASGFGTVFFWALPQLMRDGLVLFGEEQEMDAFADVSFPIAIGAEASVAPSYSTQVVTGASGHEYRNANWSSARLQFDAGPGVRSDAEMETLLAFFRARRGSAQGFRFRDPFDHSSNGMTGIPLATDQLIGVGDGVRVRFGLAKAYGANEAREITRPVSGSVRVAIDGVEQLAGWSLEGGDVLFDVPPSVGVNVEAGFLFDVPVRFAEDRLEINRASFQAGEAPSVPLVEIRK